MENERHDCFQRLLIYLYHAPLNRYHIDTTNPWEFRQNVHANKYITAVSEDNDYNQVLPDRNFVKFINDHKIQFFTVRKR